MNFSSHVMILLLYVYLAVINTTTTTTTTTTINISQTANPTGKGSSYVPQGTSRESNLVRKGKYEERGQIDKNNKKGK